MRQTIRNQNRLLVAFAFIIRVQNVVIQGQRVAMVAMAIRLSNFEDRAGTRSTGNRKAGDGAKGGPRVGDGYYHDNDAAMVRELRYRLENAEETIEDMKTNAGIEAAMLAVAEGLHSDDYGAGDAYCDAHQVASTYHQIGDVLVTHDPWTEAVSDYSDMGFLVTGAWCTGNSLGNLADHFNPLG